jgi:hypothetical protein
MTCDRAIPLLSELVDLTLSGSTVADVERHLEQCGECRAVLADLRAIRQTARTMDRLTPPDSVWKRVTAEISAGTQRVESAAPRPPNVFQTRRQPRFAFAAAAAVVLMTVIGLWMREAVGPTTVQHGDSQATAATDAASVMGVEDDIVRAAERDYEQAIMGLEQLTQAGGDTLDPDIAATLSQNIAIVDRAIGDARKAVGSDPRNDELRAGLLDAFRSKLELLEQMVVLINETRQGNQL